MKLLNAVDLQQMALKFMILIIFNRFFNLVFAVIFVNLCQLIIETPHPLPRSSNSEVAIYTDVILTSLPFFWLYNMFFLLVVNICLPFSLL